MLDQRDVVTVGSVCYSLRKLEREFASGEMVYPLGPTLDEAHGSNADVVDVDEITGICRKSARPGMGALIGKERIDVHTCYWEVKLENFSGVRLEVGVGSRDCMSMGGINKEECWLFDCFGRALHEGRIRGYGCKLQTGNVVGVLLDTRTSSLSFFLQGVCMGIAFRNVRFDDDRGLYPLIVLPSVPGEVVQLMQRPDSFVSFPAISSGLLGTRRKWEPKNHRHPNDRNIIVETSDAQVIHRIDGLDPITTTVGRLKEELIGCRDLDTFVPSQLALRTRGVLLTDDSVLLSTLGISFGSAGAQLQDIYLYVPHLIS
ncbi:unnamed protein product [Choristocarpus tenellus]